MINATFIILIHFKIDMSNSTTFYTRDVLKKFKSTPVPSDLLLLLVSFSLQEIFFLILAKPIHQ